ncbi:unnamed protein product [Tilletia controversa]|nr:unnamed protein product [Tilletia controversa]
MRFLAHPVFSSAEFGAFANEMKPALETPEKPISVAIVEALPELTNFLDTVQTNQIAQSRLAEHTNDRVEQLAALTQQAYVSLSGQIQAVAQKQVRVIVTVQHQYLPSPPPPTSGALVSSPPSSHAPISWISSSSAPPASAFTSSSNSTANPASPAIPSALLRLQQQQQQQQQSSQQQRPRPLPLALPESSSSLSGLGTPIDCDYDEREGEEDLQMVLSTVSATSSASAPFSDPTFALPALPGTLPPPPHSVPSVPIYQLSRSLSTIAEVWMEWDVGVNGCASVKELERLYGARWRPSPTERKFFSNRKRLWDAVEKLSKHRRVEGKAAAMELERRRKILNKSVDWVQKHISSLDFGRSIIVVKCNPSLPKFP